MSNNKKQTVYAKGLYVHRKEANGLEVVELSFNVEQFAEFMRDNTDEKGYVRISCWEKAVTDKYGTHNATLNTWRPSTYAGNKQVPEKGDLPF